LITGRNKPNGNTEVLARALMDREGQEKTVNCG